MYFLSKIILLLLNLIFSKNSELNISYSISNSKILNYKFIIKYIIIITKLKNSKKKIPKKKEKLK